MVGRALAAGAEVRERFAEKPGFAGLIRCAAAETGRIISGFFGD
jgi:hypothetical protein